MIGWEHRYESKGKPNRGLRHGFGKCDNSNQSQRPFKNIIARSLSSLLRPESLKPESSTVLLLVRHCAAGWQILFAQLPWH
jgi:hypothetical protein